MLLHGWVHLVDLPSVGIGGFGPYLPQIRPAADTARARQELHEDQWRVLRAREGWANLPPHLRRTSASNRDEVLRRIQLFEARKPRRWQPARHISCCLAASAAKRLDGRDDTYIASFLELDGTRVGSDKEDRRKDRKRYRLEPTLRRGDQAWQPLARGRMRSSSTIAAKGQSPTAGGSTRPRPAPWKPALTGRLRGSVRRRTNSCAERVSLSQPTRLWTAGSKRLARRTSADSTGALVAG